MFRRTRPHLPPPPTPPAPLTDADFDIEEDFARTPEAQAEHEEAKRFSQYFSRSVAGAAVSKDRRGRPKLHGGDYGGMSLPAAETAARADFNIGGKTGQRSSFPGLDALDVPRGEPGSLTPRIDAFKAAQRTKPQIDMAGAAAEFRNSLPVRQAEPATSQQMAEYFRRNPNAYGSSAVMTVGRPRTKPNVPFARVATAPRLPMPRA